MTQTQSRPSIGRRISLTVLATLIACSAGCMARETQQGDSFVYTSTLLNSLLLMIIAGVILGFGATFVFLGVKPEKGRNRNPASHKAMAVIGGLAAILVGAAILIIGVPYSFLAHITVHPDRVVMRDSVLWFASGDREIWYDSVAEFAREDKPISRKGRKKENLVIRYASSPPERIEMGPRERAAYDKLVLAHQQYNAAKRSGAIVGGPPSSTTVIRYLPPYCGDLDGYQSAMDVQLEPGDRGKICYEKQWHDVTILSRSQDKTVEATWDSLDAQLTKLSTIDIFILDEVHEEKVAEARRANMTPEQIANEEAIDKLKAQLAASRLANEKKNAEFKAKYEARRTQELAAAGESANQSSAEGAQPSRPSQMDLDSPSIRQTSPRPPSPRSNTTPPTSPRRLKRYVIDIPLPQGAVEVTSATPLVPGVKLGACYWDKWEAVTVLEVHDDGAVKCKWDNWGSVYDMSREDLIIAEAVLEGLRTQQAFVMPTEREWSDATGRFKITATYVDSKQGYVKLRKPNGEEVSVPISKLSLTDRRVIRKLSSAMSD